jgi:hypothetical protein
MFVGSSRSIPVAGRSGLYPQNFRSATTWIRMQTRARVGVLPTLLSVFLSAAVAPPGRSWS